MIVNWMVEKFMFPEYEDKLVEAIKKSGANCYLFDDTDPYRFDFDKSIKQKYTEKDCVIFYGSLQRGRQVYSRTNFIPGVFYTVENYECYKYYGYYGDKLLNNRYVMMGFNDLPRMMRSLFKMWQVDTLFVRPSNGYKTFPGQLLKINSYIEDYRVLSLCYGGIDKDQLIVVAPFEEIIQESRYLIIDGDIVTGCVYSINGELIKDLQIMDGASWEFAKSVCDRYKPDEIFTLDVAKIKTEEYKVLEINSFCCAGLYNMDIDTVVDAVNKKVILQYNDYYNI